LRSALAGRVDGEVRFDAGSRAAYAQDASNYRQVPIGVVVPRTVDAAVAAIAVCREHDAPVLSRGGGTSLAGQCCNEAVVIDWTKYCHRVVSVDPDARTAIVEPGAALDKVNDALAKHGLMVGPKPSTHVSCTIGGMIGNNSCGSVFGRRLKTPRPRRPFSRTDFLPDPDRRRSPRPARHPPGAAPGRANRRGFAPNA
jgi:FAD/FMN-containing dehydrogenase